MAATKSPSAIDPDHKTLDRWFRKQGIAPRWWSNQPGDVYGPHSHGYLKILFCAEGTITFHTDDGDVQLGPGDRLDIDPGTEHAATVGPDGVTCVEASLER